MISTNQMDKIPYFILPLFSFMLPISTFGTTVCLLAVLFIWLLTGNYKQKLALFWQHPIARVFFTLMIITFLSLFYTVADSKEALSGIKDSIRLAGIGVFIYYFMQQSNDHLKRRCIQAFVLAMIITLALSYLKYFFHLLPHKQGLTEAAVFKNHIKTSFFMSMAAYFIMDKLYHLPKNILLWIALVFMLGNILFLSEARIGYIMVAFLMGYFFWYKAKIRKAMAIVGLMFALVLAIQPFSLKINERIKQIPKDIESFATQQDVRQSSIGSRLKFIEVSIQLIQQKPFFGWGVGGFKQAYLSMTPDKKLQTDNPHNEYLRIAVEFGVLGIAWFAFLIWTIQQCIKKMLPDEGILLRGFWLVCLIGCMANSWLMDFSEGMFIVFMLSMFLGKAHEDNVVNHRHNIQLAPSA